jgi:hypothetical protein
LFGMKAWKLVLTNGNYNIITCPGFRD